MDVKHLSLGITLLLATSLLRRGFHVGAMEILNKLKVLDAYPKINEDFYSRTLSGGIITLVSSIFMILLFFNELRKSTSHNATIRLQVLAFRVCLGLQIC